MAGWMDRIRDDEEATVRNAPSEWIASPDAKELAAEKSAEQHFAYRATVTLGRPARGAILYATGEDTVAAWVNGEQVLAAAPFPAWKQMPWKKFVSGAVKGKMPAGANTIAIEGIHYVANPNGMASNDAPPMIATLVVEYEDGTRESFSSSAKWKVAIHTGAGWWKRNFDDSKMVECSELEGNVRAGEYASWTSLDS